MKKTLITALVLILSGAILADNISERIRLNGFLSQGYIYTTDNDLIPNSGENGSFEFSEVGLTFSADVSDQLSIGVQFLSRDYGSVGNFDVKLDWAFADYHFSDAFGIRFGKIKTPIGFFNTIRDIDSLRPTALLPQAVYDEHMRPVFTAHSGFDLYGSLDLGELGLLDYVVFFGTVNHPPPQDAPYLLQISQTINSQLNPNGLNLSGIKFENELFYGGRLILDVEKIGFRLGGTYVYHNAEMFATVENTIPWLGVYPFASLDATGHMELTNTFFLSAELRIGNLHLVSEYMEMLPELRLALLTPTEQIYDDDTMQGWYVMGSYMFGDRLTLTGIYEHFLGKKNDPDGTGALEDGNPAYFGWRHDLTMALRYDLSFNWTLKLEYHIIDGLSKSYLFSDPDDFQQKWNMFIAKFSFNF